MAHHSYLSPDGKWVLVVLMDSQGKLTRCRVVPFDGSGKEQLVGPEGAECSTGAWSADGKWMYMSANAGGRYHIWRQRFPGGEPEQVTSGPTEEEGIAMEKDGKSFLTSVGTFDVTLWMKDGAVEKQVSAEGKTFAGTFSADGKKLFYLKTGGPEEKTELWSTELDSGTSERVVPGYEVEAGFDTKNYAVTRDGQRVVFASKDNQGISHLWVASTDHRTSPVQLPSTGAEDSPLFLPNGDLVYRALEGGKNYLYTRQQDGSGRKKVMEEAIMNVSAVSPDGKWTAIGKRDDRDPRYSTLLVAHANEGGEDVALCRVLCLESWSTDGKYLHVYLGRGTYLMEVKKETGLPELPKEGLKGPEDLEGSAKVKVLPEGADSVVGPEKYAYTKTNVRRNIFRVPVE